MRQRVALEKLKVLITQPFFNSEEAGFVGVTPQTLAYYVKVGALQRIGPGRYCDPSVQILDQWKWEELFRIVKSVEQGVVCGLSALDVHGLTDEIVRQHCIAIPIDKFPPKIPNVRFIRTKYLDLGKISLQIDGQQLLIFDKERAVVDSFRLLSRETAIKALQNLAKQGDINFDKLNLYSKVLRVNIEDFLLMVST